MRIGFALNTKVGGLGVLLGGGAVRGLSVVPPSFWCGWATSLRAGMWEEWKIIISRNAELEEAIVATHIIGKINSWPASIAMKLAKKCDEIGVNTVEITV